MKPQLSPITGKPMEIVKETVSTEYRGETFQYTHLAYRCEDSDDQFTDDVLDEVNQNQVFNEYRQRHGYPFPHEIIQLRNHYGVSASMMSEIMGFGANQWRYYEAGKVPNESNARAITAIRNKSVFLDFLDSARSTIGEKAYLKIRSHVEGMPEYRRVSSPKITTGYSSYSPEKTNELIRYFCYNLNGVFVTKMNKLLFYTDFLTYKNMGFGLTGLEYQAIEHGPVPIHYGQIYSLAEGVDMDEYIYKNGTSGIILRTHTKPDLSIFSDQEKEIIKQVLEKFRDCSAGKISEYSHNEKGWIDCHKEKQPIPYSYAFDINIL